MSPYVDSTQSAHYSLIKFIFSYIPSPKSLSKDASHCVLTCDNVANRVCKVISDPWGEKKDAPAKVINYKIIEYTGCVSPSVSMESTHQESVTSAHLFREEGS